MIQPGTADLRVRQRYLAVNKVLYENCYIRGGTQHPSPFLVIAGQSRVA